MTRFSITITGEVPTNDAEQAFAVEREAMTKVRGVVDVLPGVREARFTGDRLLEVDLLDVRMPPKVRA